MLTMCFFPSFRSSSVLQIFSLLLARDLNALFFCVAAVIFLDYFNYQCDNLS